MSLTKPPGYIKLTKESVYTDRAARGIDLDAVIVAKIEEWKASVPSGTMATLDKVFNCSPGCGCPPDAILYACKGSGHGLAAEIIMDHVFPPDGSPCAVPGVVGLVMHGPLQNPHLVPAYPKFLYKV